jgi:antitoxin (DNA-binding transcriptional repressor) of toxin-antitoxin stability system
MQTYSIEAAKADLSSLVHLAAKGQEVLLTENDKAIAKLVPLDEAETSRYAGARRFCKRGPTFRT